VIDLSDASLGNQANPYARRTNIVLCKSSEDSIILYL